MGLNEGNVNRRVLNRGFSVAVFKYGPRYEARSLQKKNLNVISATDSCRLLRGATSLHTLQDYSEATARGGTENT